MKNNKIQKHHNFTPVNSTLDQAVTALGPLGPIAKAAGKALGDYLDKQIDKHFPHK